MKQFLKWFFTEKNKTEWDCIWWYIFGALIMGLDFDNVNFTSFVLALWTTIAFVEAIIKSEK